MLQNYYFPENNSRIGYFANLDLRFFLYILLFTVAFNPILNHAFSQNLSEKNIIQQENDPPLKISQGWEYRWGDSPVDSNGVATWIFDSLATASWEPLAFAEGESTPLGRNGEVILWLRVPLPDGNWRDPNLHIRAIGFAGEIYLNQTKIYTYRTVNKPGDGFFNGPRWHLIPLDKDFPNKMLYFRIYSQHADAIGLADVQLLSRSDYIETLIEKDTQFFVLGFLFAGIGLFFLLTFISRRDQKTYFSFGLLSFSAGIWIVSGSPLWQLFFPTTDIWFYVLVPFQYLTVAGLCAYFKHTFNLPNKSIIHRSQQFFLLYGGIALFLHVAHITPLWVVETLELLFIFLLGIIVVMLLVTSIKAALKGKMEAKIITAGFAVFAVIVVFDILAGFIDVFAWAYDLSAWGLLVFLISLGIVLERQFTNAHKQLKKYSIALENEVGEKTRAAEALKNALSEVEILKNRLQAENNYLKDEIRLEHNFSDIIGQSEPLKRVLSEVEKVAATDASVLILGESGTGKELLARAIHDLSQRSERSLVKVNCAALPADLIENELFGHEKGAFTGAVSRKIGRFELASGGTIFLDEIGELSLALQPKLLRVLQEGEFERLGGIETIKVDVRVIAATNRDLAQAVEEDGFREDLYYRLNVVPIESPSLRERREDIPLLVQHFVEKYSVQTGKKIETISQSTMEKLKCYSWPGNVRELENVIERAVILSTSKKLVLGDWLPKNSVVQNGNGVLTLEAMEKKYISETLERTGWKIRGEQGAAKVLDIKPTTLASRMKKLGIQRKT